MTLSNGSWEVNPKYLKEMRGDTGELEDYIKKPDFYVKTVHLLYAESEEGKKKIAVVDPIIASLNKNSPDREYPAIFYISLTLCSILARLISIHADLSAEDLSLSLPFPIVTSFLHARCICNF